MRRCRESMRCTVSIIIAAILLAATKAGTSSSNSPLPPLGIWKKPHRALNSLDFGSGNLDQQPPFIDFGRDELFELRRRIADRLRALLGEARLDLRLIQHFHDRLVQLADDIGGRPGRRKDA